MIYCLAAVGLAVNHETCSFFLAAVLYGYFLGLKKQPSKQACVRRVSVHDAPDVFFGYYQEMYRRLGIDVGEGKKFIILEQFFGRNFPLNDFTEYTVAHIIEDTIETET